MADEFVFKGTVDEATKAAAEFRNQLEAAGAKVDEASTETTAAQIEYAKKLMYGPAGGMGAAAIEEANTALNESNRLKRLGAELDLAQLEIIKKETTARVEQLAVQRQQVAPAGLVLPPERRYPPTVGQGRAAEQEAAAASAALAAQREAALLAQRQAAISAGVAPVTHSYVGGTGTVGQGIAADESLNAQRTARQAQLEHLAGLRENQRIAYQIRQEQAAAASAQEAADAAHTAHIEAQDVLIRQQAKDTAFSLGGRAASAVQAIPARQREAMMEAPAGLAGGWSAADAAEQRYNMALGESAVYSKDASIGTKQLTTDTLRLGLAQNQASNSLRAHGALTTEYLGALARGETTINEFGYQLGATIGKFGGWAAAAAATYGALGAVVEFGKGALDAASSVQQLTRTIDGLDKNKASIALQNLSASVNVPMKEAGDAVFAFSRTFHNLDDAVTAAGLALAAYKLDGVSVTDSVKAATAIHQQFGISASGLKPVFDELAQGQQKFNARISDQIPLLQRSAAAVKNAGGNLSDYIKLTTIFLRTTQFTGSQGGTAFARSAGNFLNPDTTKGQADRTIVSGLGINVNQGYTNLIFEALKKSATFTSDQRRQLSLAVFGPQLGARTAGFFTGGAGLVGQANAELSPGGSKGVLQTELQKELGTARQQMSAFVNGLQRLGAALANSGALVGFGVALQGINTALGGMKGVIDIFNQLPRSTREVISGLVELRLLMLLISRTRIGGSIPGISRLPGFRPSEATQARQTLAIANRPIVDNLKADTDRTSQRLVDITRKQTTLDYELQAAREEALKPGASEVAALEEENRITRQITALGLERAALEDSQVLQLKSLAAANARQISYQTSNRLTQIKGPAAIAQAKALETDTLGTTGASSAANAAALAEESQAKAAAAAQARLAASQGRLTRSLEEQAAAETAAARATAEASVAATRAATAASAEEIAARDAQVGATSMLTRIGGMALALDPLTIGLVALPFAFEALKSASDSTDSALTKALKDANKPLGSLKDLDAKAKALDAATRRYKQIQKDPSTLAGQSVLDVGHTIDDATSWLASKFGNSITRPPGASSVAHQDITTKPLTTVEDALKGGARFPDSPVGRTTAIHAEQTVRDRLIKQAEADSKAAKDSVAGRAAFYAKLNAIKSQVANVGAANPSASDGSQFVHQMDDRIQQIYQARQKAFNVLAAGPDPFAAFRQFNFKQLGATITNLDTFTKAFGAQDSGPQIKRAYEIYAYMAQQVAKSGDKVPDMAKLATAQTGLASAAHKLVGDLVSEAAAAVTPGEQSADLSRAYAAIQLERDGVAKGLALAIAAAKGNNRLIRLARAAAAQSLADINSQLSSVIDPAIATIQAQGSLRQSAVSGSSPEASIQRNQIALQTARQALAKGRSAGASSDKLIGLQQAVNDASNALAQSQASNSLSVVQAQAGLATSAIMGIGPAADLARAASVLDGARAVLAASGGQGQAAILAAQQAVNNAQYAYNQVVRANAQKLHADIAATIDSKASLAEAQTLDPIKQAQLALAADIAKLKAIVRSDFDTEREYQNALRAQRTTIATGRQTLNAAIITQDEATLSFELHTQKIGDAQYIAGLQNILKTKKLSLADRQSLMTQIYDAQHAATGAADFNVGKIKIPSVYEIRRAIGLGKAGVIPGSPSTVISHTSNVTVNVYGSKGAAGHVGRAIDQALGTTVRVAMRAKGAV